MRPQDVAVLTRQLATLLKAGIPLAEALAALGEQADSKKLAMVLVEVREKVTQGTSLADTLGAYPNIFPDLYVNMALFGRGRRQPGRGAFAPGGLHGRAERVARR